ncbi:hypothetical protein K432DRAFT_262725, partial [Lepidopterella palustris CBS 459.81]
FEVIKGLAKTAGGNHGPLDAGIYIVRSERSGKQYIEKHIRGRDVQNGHVAREIRLSRQMQHPNVNHLVAYDISHQTSKASIILGSYEKGGLDTFIYRYREKGDFIPKAFVWKTPLYLAPALC